MATMVICCSDLATAVNVLSAIEYPNWIGTKRRLQILALSEGSKTLATSSDLGIDGEDELLEIARCRGLDPLRNRS
ncbi:hypothetical protein DVH24_037665 [Malus domestica]|uniref:Uncharacterized protein n=1 Tax=Malus domestica TaxID=3750 RepID=A0A498IXT2_MALDO|nr:hypothetical protein DVH24_037665 [Malus domestica]